MTTFLLDGRHIQDHFPGIGRYVFNLAKGLGRLGGDNSIRLLVNPRQRNTRYDLQSFTSLKNLETVTVAAPTRSFREQLLGQDPKLTSIVTLWHSPYYVMPYMLPVPAVLTLEDILPLVVREAMPSPMNRILYRALVGLAARRAARVITISHAACQDIRHTLGVPLDKISVVPLGVDADFHPRSASEITRVRDEMKLPERYGLYVGSNKPHKNLERLVRAWARLENESSLVIAGHWEERYPGARRLTEELGLQRRVMFRPNVTNDDLPALLSGAQMFVYPSLYEGFGLPPLEAMACGTPVVCSNASSLPEVVGEASLLFDPFDLEALAAALTRVSEDSALRDSKRAKGLARAGQFSWDRTASETLKVYHQVVANE